MAISLVQNISKDAASAASTTITFSGNTVAGNLIVLGVRVGGTSTAAVTDDKSGGSNTYNADVSLALVGLGTCYIFSAPNAGVAKVLTITLTGGAATMRICIAEFSGIATTTPLDKTASLHTNPGAAVTSGSTATTTQASELLLGFTGNNAAGTYTAGTSQAYAITDAIPTGANARAAMEWVAVAATGAYAAEWTYSSSGGNDSVSLIATYKAAAAVTNTDPPFKLSQPMSHFIPDIVSV